MNANRRPFWRPVAAIVVLLATVFAPRPESVGLWLHTLFEWLHVPVFGLISLALLALLPTSWRPWQRFGLALLAAIVLGMLTEAIQIPMRRDASWEDIFADGTGAAVFLLGAFALGRKPVVAIPIVIAALSILIGSAQPVIAVTQAIAHRNSQFPLIFGGDINSEAKFVLGIDVRMTTHREQSPGRLYTRIEFVEGRRPRIEIRDLVADWSNYSVLVLDLEVEGEKDMELTLRIHDKLHRRGEQPHDDRFNQRFFLHAGHNTLSIPLADIKASPRGRLMDMFDIDALIIFSREAGAGQVIRLYEIRLD